MELREKIANAILEEYADANVSYASCQRATDAILSLPEIAEALSFHTGMMAHSQSTMKQP